MNNMEFIAYHGTDSDIKIFSDEFAGGVNAVDADGPGIYCTNSAENAAMWGKKIYKLKLTFNKVISNTKSAEESNREDMRAFLDMISDEDYSNNRSSDIETDKLITIDDAIDYFDTEDDAWDMLRREQFNGAPQKFMRMMTKLGYDAMLLLKDDFSFDDVNDVYHYIVYNPNSIKILEVKENTISENVLRKYIKKIIAEFATVQSDLLPDLKVDPEWRVPQVGSKKKGYDVENGKIIFNKPHDPNTLYDFVINKEGNLFIGFGHFKMAEKSDIIKAAGSLKVNSDGKIYYIDNTSGHYRPDKRNLRAVFYVLKNMGVLSNKVKVNYKY